MTAQPAVRLDSRVASKLKELLTIRSAVRGLESRLWACPELAPELERLMESSRLYAHLNYASSIGGTNVTDCQHTAVDAMNDRVIASELDRAKARANARELNSILYDDPEWFVVLRTAVSNADSVVINALRYVFRVTDGDPASTIRALDAAIYVEQSTPVFRLVRKMHSGQPFIEDARSLILQAKTRIESRRHGY